jgi:hypothetical protein
MNWQWNYDFVASCLLFQRKWEMWVCIKIRSLNFWEPWLWILITTMWENANLFTLVYFFIWWVNILILKNSRSIISTNCINQRVNFNKIYFKIHICNDITFGIIWKQNSNHMELKIKNKNSNTMKTQMFICIKILF